MPVVSNDLPRDRVEFDRSLTRSEVSALADNGSIQTLQTSSPVDPTTWDLLNRSFFPRRPDVTLRVYGFYGCVCDLSFLRQVPTVRRFAADCMLQARGVGNVSALPSLKALSIGIFELRDFDFLQGVPEGLRELHLGSTRSKKPSVELIGRFHELRSLGLEGQQKGIEVITTLGSIQDLSLWSIKTEGIDYVRPLSELRSLSITLGGIGDLSGIAGMCSIRHLSLRQVRGLRDLSPISSLTGLQFLWLDSLRWVSRLPDLSRLTSLKRIYLENMKGLVDISSLGTAPSLEDFIHVDARGMELSQYRDLLANKSLRHASVGFGSDRKNRAFDEARKRAGISEYRGDSVPRSYAG